jgi:type II secretory pathway pseudopilin PulG
MVISIKKKRAIAMIELIFALVIMGIVLMSAPMLIHQSIKSSNVALQQEAIAAAASQTAIILSMHWDEKNTLAGNSNILETNRTSFLFSPAGLIDGEGEPLPDVRTFDTNDSKHPTISTNFGTDTNETSYIDFDDVDDYHNSDFGLMLFNNESTTADLGEYVDKNISINTTVRYTQENNVSKNITTGSFSNIKFIKVNLTSNQTDVPELEKDITFKAFSCNIGTYSIIGELK